MFLWKGAITTQCTLRLAVTAVTCNCGNTTHCEPPQTERCKKLKRKGSEATSNNMAGEPLASRSQGARELLATRAWGLAGTLSQGFPKQESRGNEVAERMRWACVAFVEI